MSNFDTVVVAVIYVSLPKPQTNSLVYFLSYDYIFLPQYAASTMFLFAFSAELF